VLGRSEVAVFQNRHLPCRFDSQRNRQTRTQLFSGQLGFVLEVAVASVTLRAIPYVVQELAWLRFNRSSPFPRSTAMIEPAIAPCKLNTRLRVIVSPCRSGSTALLNCMAQHPLVQAYYQSVKAGLREGRKEDYRLFYAPAGGGASVFMVDKETLGPHTPAESALRVFPEEEAVRASRPIFLFRDPTACWNGWFTRGWRRFDLYQLAYTHAYQTWLFAKAVTNGASSADPVICVTYDQLTGSPEVVLRAICRHWQLLYCAELLDWRTNIGQNVKIRGGADFERSIEEGTFAQVQRSHSIEVIRRPLEIPGEDVQRIA